MFCFTRFGRLRFCWPIVLTSLLMQFMHVKADDPNPSRPTPRVYSIPLSSDAQYLLQARLIEAIPGDVIQFEEGRYEFRRQIDIAASHLTIRGCGSSKTILSFKKQSSGSYGIEATGDAFTVEGLAVEDTTGNAIKVLGANGVTFRDVRTEWTGGEKASNGAYGLYPVQCQNVLIENCTAIGASDAGIYVGQCHDVIVRDSRAERNVAGIEIENTVRADVYNNVATNNTGGLLVFDLPGLQVKRGHHVRIFKNEVISNNHVNFAAPGNMVAMVPQGTGVMVMATDSVEVFDNVVSNHQTSGVSVVSFLVSGKKQKDKTYDPYPESIHVHDNRISKSGWKPAGEFGALLTPVLGREFPDMLTDGVVDQAKFVDGALPENLRNAFVDNGDATFANINFGMLTVTNIATGRYKVDRQIENYQTVHRPLSEVSLAPSPKAPAEWPPEIVAYKNAPRKLSEYGLFDGDLAEQQPAVGVFPYELNTALFSDYAAKFRFIRVPEGTQVKYKPRDVFEFPVGTVIAKTFAYPADRRDPHSTLRLIETRVETRLEAGWFGYTYVWNDEQSDAELALGGGEVDVSWIHDDGEERAIRYQIPNANQCLSCHEQNGKFEPIGPTAANLNRLNDFDGTESNQLMHFAKHDFVSGVPAHEQVPTMPVADDSSTGNVSERARAWLHVNCAHCHSPVGTARTSGLDLRMSQQNPTKFGAWKSPVAAGHGSGGRSYDIVPGKPDESILLFRVEANDPSIAMPNVGRSMVPVEAAKLVREWISLMPAEPVDVKETRKQ